MGESLLYALIEGSIDPVHVINGIKSGHFVDPQGNFKVLEDRSFIQEFVPYFLNFVKVKLSKNLGKDEILSYSPKRHYRVSSEENAKGINKSCNDLMVKRDIKVKKSYPGDFKSNSAESAVPNVRKHNVRSFSDGKKKPNSSSKHRHAYQKSTQTNESSDNSHFSPNFSVLSTDNNIPNTSTPHLGRQNQKRRITPTLVTPERGIFHEKGETQRLFETSPVVELSESRFGSNGSMPGIFPFDNKCRSLGKSKRGKKRNEIPLSAILASDERMKDERVLKPENDQEVATDISGNHPKESINHLDASLDTCNMEAKGIEGDSAETEDLWFKNKISDMRQMTTFVKIYACILMENLISNVLIELCFLHSVVNCSIMEELTTEADEVIFDSVESCVYFAAKVLEESKSLSVVFDMATLNLISQNKRLHLLAPDLVEFVKNKLKDISLQTRLSVPELSYSSSLGVPFQVEGDNRKLFSSDRYFYSFSKMRDKFYGLLRKWEENHLKHDWNMEKELGERFQSFFFEFSGFPVYSQFSQLFIAQLIEMSSQDFSGFLGRDEPASSSFLEYLKSKNPSKFQRLQERFFSPMVSQGPCPKLAFSDVEAFFKMFIERSCNFHFLVHLRDNLISRILKINSIDCVGEGDDDTEALFQARNDYSINLSEARTLSKFLGYIVFSPYESDDRSKHQSQEVLKNDVIIQPFDPHLILTESASSGNLLLTIPWIVLYLSCMNETSLKLKFNHNVFCELIHIYRSQGLRFTETNLNGIFILFQLGWLFEQPLISSHVPFYKLLENKPTCWNKQLCDWRSSSGVDFISKSLLIRFCPYIGEIKTVLSKTGSGSLRKIKPLTHIDKVPVVDSEKILRETMVQDFFKYKPKYFKETADFVIERFCANLKLSISTALVPAVLKDATESLKKLVVIEEGKRLEIEELKQKNAAFLKQILSTSKPDLEAKMRLLCDDYCKENSQDVISRMLPISVDERVVQTAAKIISYDVKQKMHEWMLHNISDKYQEDLNAAFHKLLMGEVKRSNKSLEISLP